MRHKRYPETFRFEAVKQVTERGHNVAEVAILLGTTAHNLYDRIKRYGPDSDKYNSRADEQAEIQALIKS